MRKKLVSVVSLLIVAVSSIIGVFNTEDAFAADGDQQSIYATEDTTLVYESSGNFLDEDGEGVLSVGYMDFYNKTEAQILLNFTLPTIPSGYEIESASLYFPVTDANTQSIVPFSLKVSTSTNHSWVAGLVNSATVPEPTIGSTQSIPVPNNVNIDKPILGPIDITRYIIEESLKTTPKATLILSAFSYADAVASNITNMDHYINTGEINSHLAKPHLIITYSEIQNIEITGVENGVSYKSNVTPKFNIGTATLNGAAFLSGLPVSAEGSYTLIVTVENKSEKVQFTIDKTSPTGTVSINSGAAYATSQQVTLDFTLGPGVTDVARVQFSNDDLTWSDEKKYSASMNYTLPVGDGSKTVYVRFIDRAGNVGPPAQVGSAQDSIILDTTPPTGTISATGSSITNSTVVPLTVTSSNADYMELGEVGESYGTKVAYSGSTQSYTLKDIVEDGVKTLQVRLSDLAGNTTVLTTAVTLDRIAPTGKVVINGGNSYTNLSDVLVEVTPATGVTDITAIQYTINGSAPTTIAYRNSFEINIGSVDGENAVTIQLIDGAGNVSPTYTLIITLDTVAPTGTVVINNGDAYTTEREVNLALTPVVGVTDVVYVKFSGDNLTWSANELYIAGKTYTFTLPAVDDYKTVYVQFIDHAGTVGSAQDSIILDMTAPIVTGVTDGESYSSSRTINFNEGTATLNRNSFINGSSVGDEGSYILIVTDAAGNSSTITFNILKYRVSYDGNRATGGLVPIDSQTYETGNRVTVADNTGSLVKTGYAFKGWNSEADGSGTSYAAKDIFNISTANVTLYAMWDVNHYTLSFESNGGSVVATQNKSYNETATEPSTPTKSGYTFGGWYKEITLTNQWIFTKDMVTADMTLYAKWIANSSSGSNGGGSIPTPPPNSTVYFETNGGNSPAPEPSQESEPAPDGSKSELPLSLDDISGHWGQGMIEELASQGIITGYPDGSFHPNESIQRQHMALIFMRAFEFEPTREAIAFSDVSPSHPSYKAITLLQQAGIVDGSNGRFNLTEPVTRAQMAKIVALALKIELGGTSTFQDVPSTHWSHAYITALAELEIVLGDNGKFNPNEPVTRAEFVAMIYRALNLTK
ncbi:S-layer homology domain-containing protein [Paenibacillus antarcticus]|nr:S-layer homology domain-containing protein [Paenibacillus antarcticus]